jgi:CO dehydrogenase maturation factor
MKPDSIGLIVNRAPGGELNAGTKEEIENQGLTLFGVIPQDTDVYEYDCDGKPTVSLPEDSPVRRALYKVLDDIFQKI